MDAKSVSAIKTSLYMPLDNTTPMATPIDAKARSINAYILEIKDWVSRRRINSYVSFCFNFDDVDGFSMSLEGVRLRIF